MTVIPIDKGITQLSWLYEFSAGADAELTAVFDPALFVVLLVVEVVLELDPD